MAKNDDFHEEPHSLWIYRALKWPSKIIKRLYAWMMKWGDSPRAEKALFGFAFAESSFFPIPPDPLLIAMVIANVKKWLRLAGITTLASVAGGILGYFIGYALFESVGQPIIDFYNYQKEFDIVGTRYNDNAFWAILIAGFTPIPFKVFTIASGVFGVNLVTLLAASTLGRSARFVLVAWLSKKLGARYKDKIERYIDVLGLAFLATIVLGFMAIRLL